MDIASERKKCEVSISQHLIRSGSSCPCLTQPFYLFSLLSCSAADLSEAEPTLTHMSITRLHEQKLVRARAAPPRPGGELLHSVTL